ncbi:hypothetical protein AAFF_G00304940 [Aldrovandia affinis]|uniref:Uncharacterized protein n=1 Tax=Aldrovandia affinis TaxID=143900 RepID=A0AAD7SQ61_9TELE|nr:hypothetical protein AAFF_G00304940 [Aldrovandia affinis]
MCMAPVATSLGPQCAPAPTAPAHRCRRACKRNVARASRARAGNGPVGRGEFSQSLRTANGGAGPVPEAELDSFELQSLCSGTAASLGSDGRRLGPPTNARHTAPQTDRSLSPARGNADASCVCVDGRPPGLMPNGDLPEEPMTIKNNTERLRSSAEHSRPSVLFMNPVRPMRRSVAVADTKNAKRFEIRSDKGVQERANSADEARRLMKPDSPIDKTVSRVEKQQRPAHEDRGLRNPALKSPGPVTDEVRTATTAAGTAYVLFL